MKAKFIGAIERVTGSCTLLEQRGTGLQFLVDCGAAQGDSEALAFNMATWPFTASRLAFVLLTHAHIDHCGLLPRLVREGFGGRIICTRFTAELTRLNLQAAAGLPGAAFTRMDVDRLQYQCIDEKPGFAFGLPVPIGNNLFASFQPTAHIGGACSITIRWLSAHNLWIEMTFSGDLGLNTQAKAAQPLLAGREPLMASPKYLLVESTYGGRKREEQFSSASGRIEAWSRIIHSALKSEKAAIVVPCFSIHRSQELLVDIHAILDGRMRHELSESKPWILEESNRKRVLQKGILAGRIDGHNSLLSGWTEDRVTDFHRVFERRYRDAEAVKKIYVYLPVCEDQATHDEALALISEMREFSRSRRIQVILDSSLAQKVTAVYRRELKKRISESSMVPMYRSSDLARLLGLVSEEQVDALTDRIFIDVGQSKSEFQSYTLRFCKPYESEEIMKDADLNIVLSSSGMCEVGPIVPHLVRELPNASSTIVLTGYAPPGTVGGKLRSSIGSVGGYNGDLLQLGETTMSVGDICARIEDLGGYYSGHTDIEGLLDFVFHRASTPTQSGSGTRIFVNHGEDSKREALASFIRARAEECLTEDCQITGIELPMLDSTWFDLDQEKWLDPEPIRPQQDIEELVLRLCLEQRRTNDLLSEMLREQGKLRKSKPIPAKR